jgi:predicted aspartyl protease
VITRRALVPRLALLTAGGGAVWLVRDRLPWLGPRVAFANGRETAWLPLSGHGGLIEVAAVVNGTAIRAVIDSGAEFSAIDRGLAGRLGLPRTTALPLLAYGVSGQPDLTHTVKLDFAVPGLEAPGLHAAALDLARLSSVTGRDFSMLVGRDVLSRLVVEADLPGDRVRFLAPGLYRPPPDALTLALRRRGGAPVVAVRVEDAAPVDVMVDTGATGLLALSAAAARDAGLVAPGRAIAAARSVSLGGLSLDRVAVARTVQIAGLTLRNVGVQIYTPGRNSPAPAGLLGAGFLRRFRIALDLGESRLHLIRPGLRLVPAPPEPTR